MNTAIDKLSWIIQLNKYPHAIKQNEYVKISVLIF